MVMQQVQPRSNRFKLARAIEDVDNQIALLRARVATWEQEKATLLLAQEEFDRAERLLKQMLEEFHRRDPGGDLDRIYAEIVKSGGDSALTLGFQTSRVNAPHSCMVARQGVVEVNQAP